MSAPVYEVLLEKKGRGRSFLGRPWSVRTFKLKGQTLEYYDGDKLKGDINIAGSSTAKIAPDEADSKLFPFAVNTKEEKLILNASCEEIRLRCIEIFNYAASDPNWTLQPKVIEPEPEPVKPAYEEKIEKATEESNAAQTAAVAHMFAENAEKQRLEAEQKRLEEERLRAQTEAAAKLLEDELANKKLREAKEAERKQREEQERQIMELLKGMGAKLRFKTALANGKMAVAREAAAVMVQGAYRAKLARRRMLIQKAEKDRLRREAYAKKIQCRYRARLARKKMEKVKAEKLANKKKLSVMKIQCCWRIFIARKKYRLKQEAKLEAEFQKSVAKSRYVILLQTMIRSFLAKRRVARIRATYPSAYYVTVNKAEGLSSAHGDPVAYVSSVCLNLPHTHPARYNPNTKITDDLIRSSHKVFSHFKVDGVTTNKPKALVTALMNIDFIAVTLVDKGSKDEFLGQALFRTSEVVKQARLSLDRTVTLTVALNSQLLVAIQDEKKENLAVVRKGATGTITVTINVPDPAYTMCGYLYKVSESFLSGGAWKKRWFVLIEDEIQYYNSEFQLEQSKNLISCPTVTSVKEENHKGRNGTKITFTAEGVESFWILDWDENANAAIKRMWLRKIYRSCSALTDPTMEALKSKFANLKAASHDHKSISPHGKTKVPVMKRMSVFK